MGDDTKQEPVEPTESDVAPEVSEDAEGETGQAGKRPERGDGSDYLPAYLRDDPNARDLRGDGNDVRDFVGVDAEYMNYADIGGMPILTDEQRLLHTDQYDHLIDNAEDDPTLLAHEAEAEEVKAETDGEAEAETDGETDGETDAPTVSTMKTLPVL